MYLKITLQSQYQGSGFNPGPFNIVANPGGYTFNGVSKSELISGKYIDVPNSVTGGTITSNGYCSNSINWSAPPIVTPTLTSTSASIGATPTPTSAPIGATPTLTSAPIGATPTLTSAPIGATPTPTSAPIGATPTPTSAPSNRVILLGNAIGETTSTLACDITTGLSKYIDYTRTITAGLPIFNDTTLTVPTNYPYNDTWVMLYDQTGPNGVNGEKRYAVKFDNQGLVNNIIDCSSTPNPTPTPTRTPNPTATSTPLPNSYPNVKYGTTSGSTCSAVGVTVYSFNTPVVGSIIYNNQTLLTPLTGYNYIFIQGLIFTINSSTGELLTETSLTCSGQL